MNTRSPSVLLSFALASAILVSSNARTAQAQAQAQAPVTLDFYATLQFMGPIVEALRRMMNEHSTVVRIRVNDARNIEGFKKWNAAPPDQRRYMVPWDNENNVERMLQDVEPAMPGGLKVRPMALMAVGTLGCSGFGTLKPEIENFDAKGMSGRTLQNGFTLAPDYLAMQDALGMREKIKNVAHGDDQVTVRELKNGVVDVSYMHFSGPTRVVPVLAQLMQERRFYFVDARDAIDALLAKDADKWPHLMPFPLYQGDLPRVYKLNYDPVRKAVAFCIGGRNPLFYASPEMPEDVAYEFVSKVLKNLKDFDKYLTGDVEPVKTTIGLTMWPQINYHPGARRAYVEAGMPYGLDGTIAAERKRAAAHGHELHVPPHILSQLQGGR